MTPLDVDAKLNEAKFRSSLALVGAALAEGRAVRALPDDALAVVSRLWWTRLLSLLPPSGIDSLARELARSEMTVTEYFSLLMDRRAPAAMSFFIAHGVLKPLRRN